MPEFVEAYWPYLVAAAVIALALIMFLIMANRKTSVITDEKKDVLDEGAAPASRNQALIDADAAAKREAQPAGDPSPEPEPEPKPAAAPSQPVADAGASDDLTVIKGLGPKIATMLNQMGITHYAQIASWTDSDVAKIDAQLGRFAGRIERDNWVEQAKLLSSGDELGFATKFGQNG